MQEKWIRVKVTERQYGELIARATRDRRTLTDTVWFGLVQAGYITDGPTPAAQASTTATQARPQNTQKQVFEMPTRPPIPELLEWEMLDEAEKASQIDWVRTDHKRLGLMLDARDHHPIDKEGHRVLRNQAGQWVRVGARPGNGAA